MDSLFWKQINSDIVYEPTRKQFFGKYCYKLVFKAYGSRCVTENRFDTITELIDYRLANHRSHNYGGSWRGAVINELRSADIGLLEELKSIKNGYADQIKMRIEEPWVQIYAQNEDTLKNIANRFSASSKKAIISVSTPDSPEYEKYLRQDVILIKKDTGYRYKIFLRDGNYGHSSKMNISNYLLAVGGDVRYPHSVDKQLQSSHGWIWGCYFYAVDQNITTALNLIQPGIVGKIHELVVRKL
jgi:hypothetical protein